MLVLPVLGEVEKVAGALCQGVEPVPLDPLDECVRAFDSGRGGERLSLLRGQGDELHDEEVLRLVLRLFRGDGVTGFVLVREDGAEQGVTSIALDPDHAAPTHQCTGPARNAAQAIDFKC